MNEGVIQACKATCACLKLKNRETNININITSQDFHDVSGKNAYSWASF